MSTVVTLNGKQKDFAESLSVQTFSNEATANAWCESVTDLDSDYWTYAQIVTDGLVISTYKPKQDNEPNSPEN